jgi:hypothetical protein
MLPIVVMIVAFASRPGAAPTAPAQAADPCTPLASFNVACHSDWMNDMASTIAQRPLTQLVLPGSHDAGTYVYQDKIHHFFDLFAATQNLNIGGQLLHGIRRFDLRFRPNNVGLGGDPTTGNPTGIYVFHGAAATTDYRFETVIDEIRAFATHPAHAREILYLDMQLEGGPEAYNPEIVPFYRTAYAKFASDLGSLLIHPSMVTTAFSRGVIDWAEATTVQDIWDLPGQRRIIANVTGDGRLSCPARMLPYLDWSAFNSAGWYADQCYAERYGVDPFNGIKNAAAQALAARAGAQDPVPAADVFGFGFPTVLGAQVTAFYDLGVQPTQSTLCIPTSPWLLQGEYTLVLNAVLDWYNTNQHNARRNLNIISADFVEKTPLMSDVLLMNGGPTVQASAVSGGAPYAPGTGAWTNQDVRISFSCSTSFSGDSTSMVAVGAALGQAPGGSLAVTVDREGRDMLVNAACMDTSGRVAVRRVKGINIDKTPPVVAGSHRSPEPKYTDPAGNRWWNASVTVRWTCTDTLSGVDGLCPNDRTITGEGRNLTATSDPVRDRAGNVTTGTFTANIDRTPPVHTLTFTAGGAPYRIGAWTNKDVTVTMRCTDTLSGVAAGDSTTTVTTEGANQVVQTFCRDNAGNAVSLPVQPINIDKATPVTTATPARAANAAGWYSAPVAVTLAATDALSGVTGTEYNLDGAGWVAYTGPVTISAEGIHTLQYRATDVAGNVEAAKSLTVRLDTTGPEAALQYDAARRDVALGGRDATAGMMVAGPLTPAGSVPTYWDASAVFSARTPYDSELRTYTLTDRAGNTLVLTVVVNRSDTLVRMRIVSTQVNGGAVVAAPTNTMSFTLTSTRSGSPVLNTVVELVQEGQHRVTTASANPETNQTTITTTTTPDPFVRGATATTTTVTRPGQVLVRLATTQGKLAVEF